MRSQMLRKLPKKSASTGLGEHAASAAATKSGMQSVVMVDVCATRTSAPSMENALAKTVTRCRQQRVLLP